MTDPSAAPPNLFLRWTLITAAVGGLAASFAYAAGWLDPQRLTPAKLVNSLERNAGVHPGYRRNHAKGLCVIGRFASNGAGSAVSRASLFRQGTVPVVGRLAIPGGNPAASDGAAALRSFALRLRPANGEEWRTGMNSSPVFVVNSPQGFYDLQQASQPQAATGKPDPARLAAFFQNHPESAAFRQWAKDTTPSSSFANSAYYGLNAFVLVDADGREQPVRWSLQPEAPYQPLAAAQRNESDFLAGELAQRLASGPLRWRLLLTLGEAGDPTADATRAWPPERRSIDAGELLIDRLQAEQGGECQDVNYDPLILPDGIRASDDPLLSARSAAYSESFNRRTREQAVLAAKELQP
ncbi:catalase family peroxidase [Pseudomonas panipatensis]|uniref:Catalase-related peroxidase n=1 Tax=Pseudomonas panipatensis TaxID=428992 RepID=A0A1G8CYW1_9PSED|nr:catalase family peroxidase [Pseudomonas panipatensis]SDH50592.1 catalase [Pseudomonas panipatensis]SMP63099.1 catalase [Pseudomonas panipatensis]